MKVFRFHRHKYTYEESVDGLTAMCAKCDFTWTQLRLFQLAA